MEGIDAIRHLLERVGQLQAEVLRLRLYESDEGLGF